MISTDFRSDTWIDWLEPIEKLLYIYCFTNDKSSWCWATEIPIKKISYETWIDLQTVSFMLEKFETYGKVAYKDWHLIVKNFIKRHFNWIDSPEKRSKNNQLKAIEDEIRKLPDVVYAKCYEFVSLFPDICNQENKGLARGLQETTKGIVPSPLPSSSPLPSPIPSSSSFKEETEKTTDVVPGSKPKSIINKQNKPWAIQIYDKIKEMCVVVDWTLDDCVVLRSRLEKYWTDPTNLLEIMITKMRDTWLSKFYSVSSPWKLADNIGTIVEKLKAETEKQKTKRRVF